MKKAQIRSTAGTKHTCRGIWIGLDRRKWPPGHFLSGESQSWRPSWLRSFQDPLAQVQESGHGCRCAAGPSRRLRGLGLSESFSPPEGTACVCEARPHVSFNHSSDSYSYAFSSFSLHNNQAVTRFCPLPWENLEKKKEQKNILC